VTALVWGAAGVAAVGGLYTLDRVANAVVRPVPGSPEVTVPDLGISHEDLEIPAGRQVLKGWLLHGGRATQGDTDGPLVLLTHGWGASYGTVLQLAVPLVDAGYDVLVFDVRGHGRNAAVPFATVRHFRDDVEAVVRYAHTRFPARRLVAAGHSMGAAAVVLAAARGAPVDGLVLVASPADVLEVTADYLRSRGFPGRFMVVALRPFWWMRIRGSFRRLVPATAIAAIRQPVLIVQAGRDRRVPADHAERLSSASHRPVHVIPGAGHTEVLGDPRTHRLVLDLLETVVNECEDR
jgi:pimeloyl-ACP methyl ester carboxylesterase